MVLNIGINNFGYYGISRKCIHNRSCTPLYNNVPCLCNTKLYALRYNSSKLNVDALRLCISSIADANDENVCVAEVVSIWV